MTARRILVIKLAALGDVVQAFGHFAAIRAHHPGAYITLLTTPPFAPLLARYRGIFFAMLTLALSMVCYGVLVKTNSLGGSDGFNMGRATLLGQTLSDERVAYVLYGVTIAVSGVLALLARVYFDSTRGLIAQGGKYDMLDEVPGAGMTLGIVGQNGDAQCYER